MKVAKHLLKAHTESQNPSFWDKTKPIMADNNDVLCLPELTATVQSLVIQFALCGREDVCDDVMSSGNGASLGYNMS